MNSENTKTPLTRLMDLTAGWAEFVQEGDGDVVDPAVSTDELCDLYQEAGLLMVEELSPREEVRQVRRFVEDRILPLLLRESSGTLPVAALMEKAATLTSPTA